MHKLAYRCTGTRRYVFDIVHRCVTILTYAVPYISVLTSRYAFIDISAFVANTVNIIMLSTQGGNYNIVRIGYWS